MATVAAAGDGERNDNQPNTEREILTSVDSRRRRKGALIRTQQSSAVEIILFNCIALCVLVFSLRVILLN